MAKYSVKEINERIDAKVKEAEALEIDQIRQYASIDCGTGNLEGNAKVVALTDAILEKIPGIKIRHISTPTHGIMVVATLNEGNPNGKIVLNGHLDTVFKPGDVAAHPFHIEGDIGYGLGAVDCKGGLVVAMNAVRILSETGLLPDKEIRFLFNCDEEVGSTECGPYLKEEAAGAEMALVFEPARGNDGILTARKGNVTYKIEIHGVSAHAGTSYLDGRSAVVELAKKIMYLYEHNIDEKSVQFNIAGIKDGGRPRNVIPDYAEAQVSVRFFDADELAYIEKCMKEVAVPFIDGCTVNVTRDGITEAMSHTEGNINLYKFIKGVGAEIGMDLEEQITSGSGDAGLFTTMGIPSVDALGPHMFKIHSTEEHFRISSIQPRTRLAACILAALE